MSPGPISPALRRRRSPRARRRRLGAALVYALLLLGVVAAAAVNAPALHLLGSDPIREFPAPRRNPPVAAVFLSGDMGFDFGMGAEVAAAVAARGIPVIGVSSPVLFARHRTRVEVDAIVASAIRLALRRTGAGRIVLMGQSYGADIVATAAPDLSPALRSRIAVIDLTVPARDVYFRADPSGLAYLGTPDAHPAERVRALGWAPVICVHGVEEKDSLCPVLKGTAAQVIGLPGGHYLKRDPALLIATTLRALRTVDPTIGL